MLANVSSSLFAFVAQADLPAVEYPWYQSGWGVFGLFLLVVIGSYLAANAFTKSIRMPEQTPRIWTILLVVLTAILLIVVKWPPKFGVDLRGGINFVGQLNLEALDTDSTGLVPSITAADIIGVLSQRINPGGQKEIVIRALGADKIEVIIPEVDEAAADDIWNRLVKTGHLKFRIAAQKNSTHNNLISAAEKMAAEGNTSRNVMLTDTDGQPYVAGRWYSLAREEVTQQITPETIVAIKEVPQLSALVRDRQTGRLINMAEVPLGNKDPGMDFARWLKTQGIRTPQILALEPREEMNVEGKHLVNIMPSTDTMGRPCVQFSLRGEGVSRMHKLTNRYKPTDNGTKFQLGIVIDEQLHTAPSINSVISSSGIIKGRFTQKEINDLIVMLQSGRIDVALNPVPISKQFVQSTLGEELKQKGFFAIGVSFVIILLFVFVYYQWFAGSVANLALILNLILILASVMAINVPLTLTGLAGLVLTIGMAVDANVLIFERIREELTKGASLRAAFRTGFERATITIVDSNLTTILSALILYAIGTEQLKGFAVTLVLGILMGMFTAVFCSWTVFNIAERRGWVTKLKMMHAFSSNRTIDFLGRQRTFILTSLLAIAIGLVGLFSVGGRILDIDLRGGSTAQIVLTEKMSLAEVREILDKQDFKFRDEKVTFAATEVDERSNPAMAGRSFKIDSNVPSPDVAAGDDWKRLDQMLEEIFAGKLELHQVQFNPDAIQTEEVAPPGIGSSSSTRVPPSGLRAAGWNWTPGLIHAAQSLPATLGMLTQDPAPASEPPPSSDPAIAPAGQQQPAASDSQPPAQEKQASETTPAAQTPPTSQPAPASQNPPGETEVKTNDGAQITAQDAAQEANKDPAQDAAADAANATRRKFRSKVDLTFKDPITGKSIRTMLVEASTRIDRPLEEDQIRLTSADLPTEGSVLATPLKNWTVELETTGAEDAKSILADWSAKFNQQAFFPTNSDVGGQVARDAQWQALAALVASCIGMIIYIWIRFQNLAFGIAAVVALIHDVLITLGVLALTHFVADYLGFAMIDKFKINLSIIAALLTIIGYSVNDTIVIFDRVREVRGKRVELTPEMVNSSVTQTLSRTILTSGSTLAVVFVLFLFGGETIHGFAFAMCVGIIAGTYSTIFIASPVAVWLVNRVGLNANLAEQQAAQGNQA